MTSTSLPLFFNPVSLQNWMQHLGFTGFNDEPIEDLDWAVFTCLADDGIGNYYLFNYQGLLIAG